MRRMICCLIVSIVSAIFTVGLPLQSHAGFVIDDPGLPPPGEYRKDFVIVPAVQTPSGELILLDIKHDNFENVDRFPVGVGDADELEVFDSRLMFTVDDGIGGMDMFVLFGEVQVIVSGKTGNTTGTFDTEIVSMDLSGPGILSLLGPVVLNTDVRP